MPMNDLKPTTLREFLAAQNVSSLEPLPLVHTTESFKLFKVLQSEKLLATGCNIFKGENLCYFFVGRPAYKFKNDDPQPYWWHLPLVFVTKFDSALACKRILPFDSGAFKSARLPSHILSFDMGDYDLAPDKSLIPKLIATFFGSNHNYYRRLGLRPEKLEETHVIGPMHLEILSLAQMYTQPLTEQFDDRSSVVEIQSDQDYSINAGNLLGVVLPEEFKRAAPVKKALETLGCDIAYYEFYPLQVSQYYWAINNAVERILKRAGAL